MKITVKPEIVALKDKLLKKTAYDIRAYVGEMGSFFSKDAVLTPESMEIIGVIMGSMVFKTEKGNISLKEGDAVVVGYDNGPTSKALAEAFSRGLVSQGVNVYNIGISSSGQVYHNQSQMDAQGHVQITRSHVEVTTNGAKFAVGSQGIHTYLLAQMNKELGKINIGRDSGTGKIYDKSEEGRRLYYQKMQDRYESYFAKHPRKIGVNLFGGTGLEYEELFKKIFKDGLTIIGNNIDVNTGELLADPTRKEMLAKVPGFKELLNEGVRVHSFDLDADRGSVTEGGNALDVGARGHYLGDDLSFILADYKLRRAVPQLITSLANRGICVEDMDKIFEIATTVLVDARYTSSVGSFVRSAGGSVIYHRKGHSLWKETISDHMEQLAELARFESVSEFAEVTGYRDIQIEASLHLFATDPMDAVPRDDAVENVFLLEMIMDRLNIKSLEKYFSKFEHRFITKEIRTGSISNEAKEAVTYEIVDILKKTFSASRFHQVEFDGQIRIDWDTGFIMYGMSNTSPKLTFMAEGSTLEERNTALAYLLALHNKIKEKHGDSMGMDLSENSFFIEDKTFDMPEPDKMNENDPKVVKFKKAMGI